MPKHAFVTVADASGDPAQVRLFVEEMVAMGWRPVERMRLCFTRQVADDQTAAVLADQVTTDVEDAAHRADWGTTVAACIVSDEAPQLLPIDPWKVPGQ